MNSKSMLFECLDCKQTYLADDLCDGYNCPECNGHIVARGLIKEIEEGIREMQSKIKKAKRNGLIRNYYKYHISPKPNLPPNPSNYIGGLDLSDKKDCTITINVNSQNIDKDKLTEEVIEKLYNPRNPKRSAIIV